MFAAQKFWLSALDRTVCYTVAMSDKSNIGNSCGDCVMCCLALRIEEFGKPAGTLCQHCTGKSGGINETRFEVCRGFMCGYRILPVLGDAWRPDRSGILIMIVEQKDIPEEHRAAGPGKQFVILGGENAIQRPGFAGYVSTLVSRNVAIYMSADSPKTLINKYLVQQVVAKRNAAVLKMLIHIYRKHIELRDHNRWKPMPWIRLP